MDQVEAAPIVAAESCDNCKHSSDPVAMLALRCLCPASEFSGQLVCIDGYCVKFKAKKR